MSTDEYVRWLCLLEAIEVVSSKMNQFGYRLQNKDVDWIKSLAFQKYIDERFETMKCDLHDLETNEEFKIAQHTRPISCTTLSELASL